MAINEKFALVSNNFMNVIASASSNKFLFFVLQPTPARESARDRACWEDFVMLDYVTYKYVRLRDSRLGALYYILAFLILIYSLIEIFLRKGYLQACIASYLQSCGIEINLLFLPSLPPIPPTLSKCSVGYKPTRDCQTHSVWWLCWRVVIPCLGQPAILPGRHYLSVSWPLGSQLANR